MLIIATPDVSLTPDGRIRLDLTGPLRDLLCDLAALGEDIADALDDLGQMLAARDAGPDDERSADMQDAAVHDQLDHIVARLIGPESCAAVMDHYQAVALGGRLVMHAQTVAARRARLAG